MNDMKVQSQVKNQVDSPEVKAYNRLRRVRVSAEEILELRMKFSRRKSHDRK